ncbi:MAG: hypothetical protein Q8N62_03380 [Candidatus Omnitrophota bacterium]|nr:hypothetical protein [Candidatus Omnitrophota bacterium]
MGKILRREKLELKPNLKIAFREDAVLSVQLLRFVLLAIEISDKSPEEAERIQQKFLDRH